MLIFAFSQTGFKSLLKEVNRVVCTHVHGCVCVCVPESVSLCGGQSSSLVTFYLILLTEPGAK